MINLKWQQNNDWLSLEKEGEVLLVMTVPFAGRCLFRIGTREYRIQPKGLWNPNWFVLIGDAEEARLTHKVWSTKARLKFADGALYTCRYTSSPFLQLQFLQGEEETISLGIRTTSPGRWELLFNVGKVLPDADRLLILAAIGMAKFYGVAKEVGAIRNASDHS